MEKSWPTSGKGFRQITVVEMKCIRRKVGEKARDRMRNGEIRDELRQIRIE